MKLSQNNYEHLNPSSKFVLKRLKQLRINIVELRKNNLKIAISDDV